MIKLQLVAAWCPSVTVSQLENDKCKPKKEEKDET
jgi:hypothetical protein